MSTCEDVALLPALCLAGFVGWPSSSPPNGRLVLLLDVLGRGGRLGSVRIVPVALGRHGMLWWCIAPLIMGRALAVLGLPLGGACPGGEKIDVEGEEHSIRQHAVSPHSSTYNLRGWVHTKQSYNSVRSKHTTQFGM